MTNYLLINNKTLLAKNVIRRASLPTGAVTEVNFMDENRVEGTNSYLGPCASVDDWALNYEIERAFFEKDHFDEIIIFPGELKFGVIQAIPLQEVNTQVSQQIATIIEIYRILADKLKLQKSCRITQFIYEESEEFRSLSSLPLAINGALRGLVSGLREEFSQMNVVVNIKPMRSVYTDFVNQEYSFFNDLGLAHYQPLVNRYLANINRLFEHRKLNRKM